MNFAKCGVAHTTCVEWPFVPIAHCKVATQLYPKVAKQYKLIQEFYAMPKSELANIGLMLHVQGYEEGVRVWVFP